MSASVIDRKPDTKKKRVNTADALRLYVRNTPQTVIAKSQGVTKQAVSSALKPFKELLKHPEVIRTYDDNRDKMLSAGQAKLLVACLDPKAIKKSSSLQLASAYGILFDKQRLVRGESTENIRVRSVTARIDAELKRLEQEDDTQDVVVEAISGEDRTDCKP